MKRILLIAAAGLIAGCSGSSGSSSTSASGSSGTTGSSGSGSTAGTNGSSGSGGTTGPACSGTPINASGALDLDVTGQSLAHLTGHVTLNGAALPSASGSRGVLVFTGAGGSTQTYPLGTSGDVTYQVDVVPDTYTVTFEGNAAACGGSSAMPCNSGTLKEGLVVPAGGGAFDIDIPSIQVTGAVTLNGQAMPSASTTRGSLSFALLGGGAASVGLKQSGAASYQLAILPGTYDISFEGNGAACGSSSLAGVPCNSGKLRAAVALNSSGALDVDVPAVHVTGAVTLNGGAFSLSSAGNVTLALSGGGAASSATIGAGRNQYDLTVLPGTYEIDWSAASGICNPSTPPPEPCNGGALRAGVSLTQSGALDVDVKSVQLTGQVTVNGQAMPSESRSRGAVTFAPVDSSGGASSFTTAPFGSSGAARYAVSLFPGTYDVVYDANPALCGSSTPPGVPCNGGTLRSAVGLTQGGALDLDLSLVQVTGAVTLNGAALPAASQSRGSIAFVSGDSSSVAVGLGSSGAGNYGVSLLAGTYRIDYQANPQLCGGSSASAFPCVGGPLRAAQSLTQNGALDLDVPAIEVTGNVTLNGQAMPDASTSRGSIAFTSEPGRDSISLGLSASGAAQYQVTLMPGRYAIGYDDNPSLCGTGAFPCASEILLGCP